MFAASAQVATPFESVTDTVLTFAEARENDLERRCHVSHHGILRSLRTLHSI